VVDYKATSKADEVSLDADWQIAYKRQVEFYQWLLRGNDLEISNQAWFVYANGIKGDGSFDDQLDFKTKLISYDGSDAWIEPTLDSLIECLASESPPPHTTDCPYCQYVAKRRISDTQNVPDYQPIAVNVRIPTKSIRTANKDAERDFALEILEAYPDHRCQVDDLVARVIKKNSGRITMPNKKRVLEVIYALQEAGKIRLQNGMAILVRTS
jgi:hypothetical protein